MGTTFKRGNKWWIQYYRNGKQYRESTGSTKVTVAKQLLKKREGEIAQGKLPGVHFEKVTFDMLSDDFLRDYRVNHKKSLDRAERSANHLKRFFEGYKVPSITTPRIQEYVEMRQVEGATNATINRELAALKRMLNLGAQQTPPLVDRVPKIHTLAEDNVRTGFFEREEFLRFRGHLPEYLKGFVTFGYKYGWRKEEIANLTWAQVDRNEWTVRLEVGTTKNKAGRLIYLDTEMIEVFSRQWALRKSRKTLTPYVFTNREGTDRAKDFRWAWDKAFKDSSVPRRMFHDLRRTAIRNMVRAGIPEKVAMLISGHKTRSVFERYNIVDERDLKHAVAQQEKHIESAAGTKPGTIVDLDAKKPLGGTREASS